MHLRTCRDMEELNNVVKVARVYEMLKLVKGTEKIVFGHNLGLVLSFIDSMNRANHRMHRIERAYHKLIARAKVEGLASVQSERLVLRGKSERCSRKVRMLKQSLLRLPWPARFFDAGADGQPQLP